MGAFEYTALDTAGKQRKGVLEGDTPRQIRQQLREKGFTPLAVVEVRQREAKRSRQGLLQRGISATELALFTRQFATLVRSGLPIDEALRVVSQQTERARIRSMILGVRSRVTEGHTLATALADFPHIFSDLYRSTVGAGEQSGRLDVVLERLADYAEGRQALMQKTMLALIYPVFLVIACIAIVVVLLAYVVPQVVQVFQNTGQALPILTQGLIALSEIVRDYGIPAAVVLAALIVMARFAVRREGPRRQYHRLVLALPLVGRLVRGLNTARFARTFSILAASGVPVLEAMRISAQVLSNLPMREAVTQATTLVREGSAIAVALDRSRYFPPMTVHLIASGESSGNLEGMLERAAASQEREVETLIAAAMGIFEPVLLLVMGGVVLIIVLAILLPIFDLNQLVK
jgi:general secretion pathway protein F